jgi:transcriptional regulator with XRE-family HTH domain
MTACQTELGRFIRSRRIEILGCSQDHLAEASGVPQSTLSCMEAGGHRRLTAASIRRLASVLRCSPQELITRGAMTVSRSRPVEPRNDIGRIIWRHCQWQGWSLKDIARRLERSPLQARGLLTYLGPTVHAKKARWLAGALAIRWEILLPFVGVGRVEPRNLLGKLLAQARKVRGVEVSELARHLGVPRYAVAQMMLGIVPLSRVRLLRQVARVLGLRWAALQPFLPVRRTRRFVTSDPVGKLLAEWRAALGLTRHRVAKAAGLPVYRYGRYERGTLHPTPVEFLRLIELLRPRLRGI